MTLCFLCLHRQVSEGVWKTPEDLSSQSQKRSDDLSRSSDLDILNSPPLSLSDLSTSAGLANWMPLSSSVSEADTSGPEQDVQSSMTFRNRVLDELPSRRPADKAVSAEVRLVNLIMFISLHHSAVNRNIFAAHSSARWQIFIYIWHYIWKLLNLLLRPSSHTSRWFIIPFVGAALENQLHISCQ